MTLLVVGLVAVIVVILIAVFLSTRTGRGDEHEDAVTRPRDRDRRAGEGEQWRYRERGDRGASAARSPGRGDAVRRAAGRELAPAYAAGRREHGSSRAREFDEPPRRLRRPDADARPAYDGSPPRRAIAGPDRGEANGRYDSQPPRVAADEFSPADYPPMDAPSDFPVAGKAARTAPARSGPPKGRAAHSDGGSKGRARAHRGRHDDDDDWPSTEWDKLSDEQYWAEVSADKPLSSMNPPPEATGPMPAPVTKPAPARNLPARAGQPDAAAAETRAVKPAAAPLPAREPGRDRPGTKERTGPREAVTERLPVRRPARVPSRAAIEAPRPARPAPVNAVAVNAAAVKPAPLNGAAANPAPVGAGAVGATRVSPLPASAAPPVGPPSSGDQGLAMLADLGTTTPAAPHVRDDDPLTSPSFSRKAASDSRSYGNARKNGANTSLTGLERKSSAGGGRHRAAPPADDPVGMVPLAAPLADSLGEHPSGPYPVTPAAASNGGYPAGQHPSGPYPTAPAPHPSYPSQQNGAYPGLPAAAGNGHAAGHPSGPHPAAPAPHPPYPSQHPSGPYPAIPAAASYAADGYAGDSPGASSGSWYNMPAEAASYAGAGAARTPAGFPDGHAGGYASGDGARDYPAPYRAPLQSGYPGPAGAQTGLPVRGGRGLPAEAVSHPSFPGGQPGQDAYWAGQPGQAFPPPNGNGEYAEGYGAGHHGEPYQPDGYGGYAARG
jgi:hypothetical protein